MIALDEYILMALFVVLLQARDIVVNLNFNRVFTSIYLGYLRRLFYSFIWQRTFGGNSLQKRYSRKSIIIQSL